MHLNILNDGHDLRNIYASALRSPWKIRAELLTETYTVNLHEHEKWPLQGGWNALQTMTFPLQTFCSSHATPPFIATFTEFLVDWTWTESGSSPPPAEWFPSEKRDIKVHNGPLIGAHMFSQCVSVTKRHRSCVIYEAGTWGHPLAGALVQSALSLCSVKPQWRLEALLS